MNPFPLIEFAMQLPECGKGIRQTFKVGELFRLTFLHVMIGVVHASTSEFCRTGFCRSQPAFATQVHRCACRDPANH